VCLPLAACRGKLPLQHSANNQHKAKTEPDKSLFNWGPRCQVKFLEKSGTIFQIRLNSKARCLNNLRVKWLCRMANHYFSVSPKKAVPIEHACSIKIGHLCAITRQRSFGLLHIQKNKKQSSRHFRMGGLRLYAWGSGPDAGQRGPRRCARTALMPRA
jgi:hypothetical protein